jgi:hypothetical protein
VYCQLPLRQPASTSGQALPGQRCLGGTRVVLPCAVHCLPWQVDRGEPRAVRAGLLLVCGHSVLLWCIHKACDSASAHPGVHMWPRSVKFIPGLEAGPAPANPEATVKVKNPGVNRVHSLRSGLLGPCTVCLHLTCCTYSLREPLLHPPFSHPNRSRVQPVMPARGRVG